MQILFYDPGTEIPYTFHLLQNQALGGMESTIIRIAHSLATSCQVWIAQGYRVQEENQNDVHYIPLEKAHTLSPDVVIILRHYQFADVVAELFPKAKKFIWLHNMPSSSLFKSRNALLTHQFQIIAVSEFHKNAITRRLNGKWYQHCGLKSKNKIPVHVIYNPIADDLNPDDTPWKPNQLLFMSSPHKGLKEIIFQFEKLRQYFPDYNLLISNPGYQQMKLSLPENIFFLGVLPHQQIIQKARESFCVFYPQASRVETFGLVFAEANAVGTPVLTYDMGAAREVLSDETQLVKQKFTAILEKIIEWRERRPLLKAKEEFRLSCVRERWLRLFMSS